MASLWAPVIGFMILVYGLSAQETLPAIEQLGDKVVHVGAYGLFGLLCLRAFHGGIGKLRYRPTILAISTVALYGALDEWHQSYVPGRDPSLLDWAADLIGAGLSLLFLIWLVRGPYRARRGASRA